MIGRNKRVKDALGCITVLKVKLKVLIKQGGVLNMLIVYTVFVVRILMNG